MKPLRILSAQHVIAARKLLRWTRTDLATRSGLHEEMLGRLETEPPPSTRLGQVDLALEAAFEGAGIDFGKDGEPAVNSWQGPRG